MKMSWGEIWITINWDILQTCTGKPVKDTDSCNYRYLNLLITVRMIVDAIK